MLPAQLLEAIGEEIGWRSFLQITLEKKMPVLLSINNCWGNMGIMAYLYYSFRIIVMLLFISATIIFSIIMSVILKDTENNIYVSTLLHTSFNVKN
jgi:membrane protease YdiL (CAAX protease family)